MKSIKKDQKFKHLILFDATCPLCQRAVVPIISIDKKKLFIFSSLSGNMAKKVLKEDLEKILKKNSLVLIENYQKNPKLYLRSQAIFRIYFYLGSFYRLLGVLAFFPAIFDPIYRFIARHRHGFKKEIKWKLPKDRYIP